MEVCWPLVAYLAKWLAAGLAFLAVVEIIERQDRKAHPDSR